MFSGPQQGAFFHPFGSEASGSSKLDRFSKQGDRDDGFEQCIKKSVRRF